MTNHPQSCGQCECCEAWRADRERMYDQAERNLKEYDRDIARRNEQLVELSAHFNVAVADFKRRIAAMLEG